MQNIMQNMPKLEFTNYEHQQIIHILKSSLKQTKSIENNQSITKNPTIETINQVNLDAHLNNKSDKPDYISRYNKHKPYYKDDTRPKKSKSKLEYEYSSQNIEEFDLIMNSWDYISERILILHNNQFNLKNLYDNFGEKDDFLLEIRKQTPYGPPPPPDEEPEKAKSALLILDPWLRGLLHSFPTYHTKEPKEPLNTNPPFY